MPPCPLPPPPLPCLPLPFTLCLPAFAPLLLPLPFALAPIFALPPLPLAHICTFAPTCLPQCQSVSVVTVVRQASDPSLTSPHLTSALPHLLVVSGGVGYYLLLLLFPPYFLPISPSPFLFTTHCNNNPHYYPRWVVE